ncbi:hypothetical protein [Sphingomonas hengshuiensis]|uniref:hypothetical protein n=1 Tax=Sphingomonas hengshuiensis TaxID=1609977 RepID=UPI0012B744D8|nr:hypothetical protein [Sphingomonas hengshuiensis]
MKAFPSLLAVACAMPLVGCSVDIDAENAVARGASLTEIENDGEASAVRPDGAGTWVLITAQIKKEDVESVSRWEVYPHVYIVECVTGRDVNVGSEPKIGGEDFANSNAVKAQLDAQPDKLHYQMRSLIFARKGDFQTPQCLQFRGGSMLGQKIIEKQFPIRIVGPLP